MAARTPSKPQCDQEGPYGNPTSGHPQPSRSSTGPRTPTWLTCGDSNMGIVANHPTFPRRKTWLFALGNGKHPGVLLHQASPSKQYSKEGSAHTVAVKHAPQTCRAPATNRHRSCGYPHLAPNPEAPRVPTPGSGGREKRKLSHQSEHADNGLSQNRHAQTKREGDRSANPPTYNLKGYTYMSNHASP